MVSMVYKILFECLSVAIDLMITFLYLEALSLEFVDSSTSILVLISDSGSSSTSDSDAGDT